MIRGAAVLLLAMGLSFAGQQSEKTQTTLFPFEQDGRWGYRDAGGNTVIAPRFTVAREFGKGGIAAVVDGEEWVYMNAAGNVVIRPFVVDNGPDYFSEGVARFRSRGKFGFFDATGTVVIQAQFDFVSPFSGGLAAFCAGCAERQEGEHTALQGGAWGYIGRTGAVVIAPRFEAARDFQDGRARVRTKGGWITIDRGGNKK